GQADAPAGAFTAIAAGGWHSCGIRADSTAVCWGCNGYGQADAPAGAFTAIAAGGTHSCGIRADSTAECWDWTTRPPAGVFWAY
ncbi:MAG: RCC1 domain-containing protein, partial [bacterium]|nr:RCC1 domain-containing protein [bacterium]